MIRAPLILAFTGLMTMAAAPPQIGFSMATPGPTFTVSPEQLGRITAPSRFSPAPLPNRDAATPTPEKGSKDASLAPGVFTRRDQYQGQALSPSSSVQSEQERHAKPGAGFNLTMPLQ